MEYLRPSIIWSQRKASSYTKSSARSFPLGYFSRLLAILRSSGRLDEALWGWDYRYPSLLLDGATGCFMAYEVYYIYIKPFITAAHSFQEVQLEDVIVPSLQPSRTAIQMHSDS
jgi:hypothetical protein